MLLLLIQGVPLKEKKRSMGIKKCEVGTIVQAREWYPNGPYVAGIMYNYRHAWKVIDGKKVCINCDKTPKELKQ